MPMPMQVLCFDAFSQMPTFERIKAETEHLAIKPPFSGPMHACRPCAAPFIAYHPLKYYPHSSRLLHVEIARP